MKKYNIRNVRKNFPILKKIIYNTPLIYLDNAATTQKPLCVINSISTFYQNSNANINRSSHFLAEESYKEVDNARETVRSIINAKEKDEIIFTKGTTESINLVANAFSEKNIDKKHEIMISQMEHASNILPWQDIAKKIGCYIKIIPILNSGELDIMWLENNISKKTKIIAICYASNILGTINPIKKIIYIAKNYGTKVLIDAAQALAHTEINVQDLDCDFLAASAHKAYGPTGVGFLYIKKNILCELPTWQTGGGLEFNHTNYLKFEAGTINSAGIIGFMHAIKFLKNLTLNAISNYENSIFLHLVNNLIKIKNIIIYGTSTKKVPIISFNITNKNPLDMGIILDSKGIAVRTGNLCSPYLPNFYEWKSGAIRISIGLYNTIKELDRTLEIIEYYSKNG